MPKHSSLANYLEELWGRGFKLTNEDIRLIYFGKRFTAAHDHNIIMALKFTLQIQRDFDFSFYLSLLELLLEHEITNEQQAIQLFQQKKML
ncbi:hypothetical protein Pryu01_00349 [Paraliobacillus ryukyuensis]|uniref:Uncharacterized protein n=1 Tax=Paraliobacillus ryukyuensis TaxID=200904 RepID=A0A366EJB7_9BACI|nr:DUF6123 family protein [Paraliobacillus ryukyuensis]RBP01579.1 hypothetical protein DES48_101317 [Paraliobacillus ryukyuensis]